MVLPKRFFFSVFLLGVLYLLLRLLSFYELLAKTYAGMYNVKSVSAASLVCEKSRPSSLLARVAFSEAPLGPGAKKDGCFRRLQHLRPNTNVDRKYSV